MNREPARYNGRPDAVLALVLDCADLDRAAAFWCAALGYVSEADEGAEAAGAGGDAGAGAEASASHYLRLVPADGKGVELLLQKVGEPKAGKNRMHLDLRHHDLAAETARLLAAGARHTTGEPVREDGWCWYVLQDPDGNEFCVLQPPRQDPGAW